MSSLKRVVTRTSKPEGYQHTQFSWRKHKHQLEKKKEKKMAEDDEILPENEDSDSNEQSNSKLNMKMNQSTKDKSRSRCNVSSIKQKKKKKKKLAKKPSGDEPESNEDDPEVSQTSEGDNSNDMWTFGDLLRRITLQGGSSSDDYKEFIPVHWTKYLEDEIELDIVHSIDQTKSQFRLAKFMSTFTMHATTSDEAEAKATREIEAINRQSSTVKSAKSKSSKKVQELKRIKQQNKSNKTNKNTIMRIPTSTPIKSTSKKNKSLLNSSKERDLLDPPVSDIESNAEESDGNSSQSGGSSDSLSVDTQVSSNTSDDEDFEENMENLSGVSNSENLKIVLQQQRAANWTYPQEFKLPAEAENVGSEFAEYIDLFRTSAKAANVSKFDQMDKLRMFGGQPIRQALRIISNGRQQGSTFKDINEMVKALQRYWGDPVDDFAVEEKFRKMEKKSGETFVNFLERVQLAAGTITTYDQDPHRVHTLENLVLTTIMTGCGSETVRFKARVFRSSPVNSKKVKSKRIEKFKKWLHLHDTQMKEKLKDRVDNDDLVAKLESRVEKIERKHARAPSEDRSHRESRYVPGAGRQSRPRFTKPRDRDHFNRQTKRDQGSWCRKCEESHLENVSCKCEKCGFRHDKDEDCVTCWNCKRVGHKSFNCPKGRRQAGSFTPSNNNKKRRYNSPSPVKKVDEKSDDKVNNDKADPDSFV